MSQEDEPTVTIQFIEMLKSNDRKVNDEKLARFGLPTKEKLFKYDLVPQHEINDILASKTKLMPLAILLEGNESFLPEATSPFYAESDPLTSYRSEGQILPYERPCITPFPSSPLPISSSPSQQHNSDLISELEFSSEPQSQFSELIHSETIYTAETTFDSKPNFNESTDPLDSSQSHLISSDTVISSESIAPHLL
ncbi:BA75_02799T0 [Komagataella pastoris]|uniref:BA75_02799T0 n=1 Tax=Komagataella pastoris TaxID=4922 RepID=A0A1B2JAJ9_PICPA|nr:BA75_02799T0 [Komagataella pastoris]